MNAKRIALAAVLVAMALAAIAVDGCSKLKNKILVPNEKPEVVLTAAPYDTSRASPYFYAYKMDWLGNDPDGRIAYYLYAVDPPRGGAVPWVRTTKNEQIIFFTADSSNKYTQLATRPHIFAICAVDDQGDTSAIVVRGFYAYNQCPTVSITAPPPSALRVQNVTPTVLIKWNGSDPDGQLTSKPIKYKFVLLSPSTTPSYDQALSFLSPSGTPKDSLLDYFAYNWKSHGLAGPFAGWDSCGGDTTQHQYSNLIPGTPYVFCIVAFDEAGAFTPEVNLEQNALKLMPSFASSLGPWITVFNESFVRDWKGGWTTSPAAQVNLEVAAGQPVTFNWIQNFNGNPNQPAVATWKWMLDGDPTDDTIRDTTSVFSKWSVPSLNTTSATVGPFAGGTEHDFFVDGEDVNGVRSLAHVHMTAVQSSLARDLLVVSDLRYPAEKTNDDTRGLSCPKYLYVGFWPTAGELDSFLFARGDVPWDCYGDASAANNVPGIFSGYRYSVYRTLIPGIIDRTVPLSVLGNYANVVWLTDGSQTSPSTATYALRYMNQSGHVNTLGSYVRQGGHLWLAGGGVLYEMCRDVRNDQSNDQPTFTYSNRNPSELQPGRFPYDVLHWQSELQIFSLVSSTARIKRSSRAVGGWSHQYAWGGRYLDAPDYSLLPAQLDPKSPGLDVCPPTRAATPADRLSFYTPNLQAFLEYLDQPNSILEDVDPDPVLVNEVATLDTLMKTEAPLAGSYQAYEKGGPDPQHPGQQLPGSVLGTPLMTYYHGPGAPQNVFTGFDLWIYNRAEVVQLVDFVLQRIFGISKSAPQPAPARAVRGPAVWAPPAGASLTGRAAPVRPAPAASLRPRGPGK